MNQPRLTHLESPQRTTNAIFRHLSTMEVNGRINPRIFNKLSELQEWFRTTEDSYSQNKRMPPEYSSAMSRAARNARQVNAKLAKILRKSTSNENNSLLAVDALHVFTSLLSVTTLLEESDQEPYSHEKRHNAFEKIRVLRESAFDASMLPSRRDKLREIHRELRKELLTVDSEISSR